MFDYLYRSIKMSEIQWRYHPEIVSEINYHVPIYIYKSILIWIFVLFNQNNFLSQLNSQDISVIKIFSTFTIMVNHNPSRCPLNVIWQKSHENKKSPFWWDLSGVWPQIQATTSNWSYRAKKCIYSFLPICQIPSCLR